jgi:hypothetical protein
MQSRTRSPAARSKADRSSPIVLFINEDRRHRDGLPVLVHLRPRVAARFSGRILDINCRSTSPHYSHYPINDRAWSRRESIHASGALNWSRRSHRSISYVDSRHTLDCEICHKRRRAQAACVAAGTSRPRAHRPRIEPTQPDEHRHVARLLARSAGSASGPACAAQDSWTKEVTSRRPMAGPVRSFSRQTGARKSRESQLSYPLKLWRSLS